MYDVHFYECEYCGVRFEERNDCREHELNHRYKKEIPNMGRIFIKVDGCDELKEFSAEYDAYDINTFFVNSPKACNFMQDIFEADSINSPWDSTDLAAEPGWYYVDSENCWHCLEQDIANLSAKAAALYLELHKMESKG